MSCKKQRIIRNTWRLAGAAGVIILLIIAQSWVSMQLQHPRRYRENTIIEVRLDRRETFVSSQQTANLSTNASTNSSTTENTATCKNLTYLRQPVRGFNALLHVQDFHGRQFKNKKLSRADLDSRDTKNPCSEYYRTSLRTSTVVANLCSNCSEAFDSSDSNNVSLVIGMDYKVQYCASLMFMSKKWRGDISVAIMIEKEGMSEEERTDPTKLYQRFLGCLHPASRVCLHFAVVNKSRKDSIHGAVYLPINVLRNIAIEHAKTDKVLLVEADFILMTDMAQLVRESVSKVELFHLNDTASSPKQAFVLPAFGIMNVSQTPENREKLLQKWENKTVLPIQETRNYQWGHLPTNYFLFKALNRPYKVEFKANYEPYYVINRHSAPKFPEEFLYGFKDKASHAYLMHKMGFEFIVLHDVFLLHTSHTRGGREYVIGVCGSKSIDILTSEYDTEVGPPTK